MTGKLTFALAQLNPTMGDISGNIAKLREVRERAAKEGADLLITSELYLCGYPPEDLVLKPSFQDAVRGAVEKLALLTSDKGPALLVGAPWREGGKLYNAMILLEGGRILAKVFKYDLPNYGPFDEKRIFASAPLQEPVTFRGVNLGILICEDMWTPTSAVHLKKRGAHILIVPNGSPYELGKTEQRHKLASERVGETGLPIVYVNQLGGQDELVFDGSSFALNSKANCIFQALAWHEQVSTLIFSKGDLLKAKAGISKPLDRAADIYYALMVGLRDYVDKNGFPGVVLGLSGGIDSALAATIAVDALGADRVRGVMMSSPFTSQESLDDAEASARLLRCRLDSIPIIEAMHVFEAALKPILKKNLDGVVHENIQSRNRGIILMALSNATGYMVLSTGNKSEMSVGYATLYGDLCGGFAVLKDVYKTEVYNIARWRNEHKPDTALGPKGPVIPQSTLTKAPTAELRPNQKDQDSLPAYDILDGILECLIERDLGMREIADCGFDPATVAKIWGLLDKAKYKRRQAPPGVKITRRNLSRDRRYPITNRYRERATTR